MNHEEFQLPEPSGLRGSQTVDAADDPDRRIFLGATATLAMAGGLAAGYGTFAAFAGRYLYPAGPPPLEWMFVSELARLPTGDSLVYRSPEGASISVTHQGEGSKVGDFIALSTICPHLGCHVHWEAQNNRYFCPCHNGVFDPSGLGTAGPPQGKSLAKFPLKIENGLLFIQVSTDVANAGKWERPGTRSRVAQLCRFLPRRSRV